MWLPGFVAAVLLVVCSPLQGPPQSLESLSGLDMQWVRGTVVTSTPTALTLRVKERTLTFVVDGTSRILAGGGRPGSSPAGGIAVDVHYTRRSGSRRAIVVFPSAAGARSPATGESTLGFVRLRRNRLSLGGARAAAITVESGTRLLDVEGRPLAKGRSEITQRLPDDELVVVTWYDVIQSRDSVGEYAGDLMRPRFAVEIRTLKPAPPSERR